jgi:hypothetical protein
MNKFIIITIFIFLNLSYICPSKKIDFTTVLIIIEEQENNNFLQDASPFSDGIFNAMWDKDLIFFDMKIVQPIKVTLNQLDFKPYLETAEESGADSILLIKIHYFTELSGKSIKINCKNSQFNLYSINSMKSVTNGTVNFELNQLVDNSNDKDKLLKKTGNNILNEIFSKIEM